MKNNIEMYFEKLTNDYDKEEVNIVPSNIKEEELKYVPEALHELYKVISKAELPFGEIFSIDDALKKSEVEPFKSNWFVFGHDNYFSFWLCSFKPDSDGLSFTSWDHECAEIGGAVDKDIISFLEDMEDDAGDDGYIPPFC